MKKFKKTKKIMVLALTASLATSTISVQTNCGFFKKFVTSKYGLAAMAYTLLIGGTIASFYKKDNKIKTGPKANLPFYLKNLSSMLLSLSKESLFFIFPFSALILGKNKIKTLGKHFKTLNKYIILIQVISLFLCP